MGEFDSTLGAVLIAGLLAAVLQGMTILQAFLYSQTSKADGPSLKLLVSLLCLLDTLHMAFLAHGIYHYLVSNFGIISAITVPTWSLIGGIYLTSFNGIVVRFFLAHRIFVLCGRYRPRLRVILPTLTVLLTLITFVTGWIFASKAAILRSFAKLIEVDIYLYLSFASAAAADTLIALSLCTLLYRSRTGIKQTDSLLTTLIVVTFNTGLLTSAFALSCLITYSIWPHLFIYVGMYFPLSKLYVNSLVGSLNARQLLRSKERGPSFTDARGANFSVAAPPFFRTASESMSTPGQKENRSQADRTSHSSEVYDL